MALARRPRAASPMLFLTGAGQPQPSVPAPPTDEVEHAPSELETRRWVLATAVAVGIALVSYLAAYYVLLPSCLRTAGATCAAGDTYAISSELNMFAAVFVLALAVERLLSPFSRWLVPSAEKAKDARDEAAAESAKGTGTLQSLAEKQAEVDKNRQVGVIVHWGVATAVSFLVVGQLNVLLLATIRAQGSAQPSPWADLLVTGLVIGAGTKPVHDLVAKLEKSKEAQQDPAGTGGNA